LWWALTLFRLVFEMDIAISSIILDVQGGAIAMDEDVSEASLFECGNVVHRLVPFNETSMRSTCEKRILVYLVTVFHDESDA